MVFVLLISQGRKMCSWKKVLTCLNLALVNKNFHNRCDITVAATEQQKLFVRLEKMQNSLCLSSSTMSSVSFFYNLISWPRWPVLFNIVLEKWRYYWLFSCFFNLFTIESFESQSRKNRGCSSLISNMEMQFLAIWAILKKLPEKSNHELWATSELSFLKKLL